MAESFRHTVGEEKVSITVVRKTKDDLLVSQHSGERWFSDAAAAREAVRMVVDMFVSEEEALRDGDGRRNDH